MSSQWMVLAPPDRRTPQPTPQRRFSIWHPDPLHAALPKSYFFPLRKTCESTAEPQTAAHALLASRLVILSWRMSLYQHRDVIFATFL